MKVDKLIKKLRYFQKEYGNVDVEIFDLSNMKLYPSTTDVVFSRSFDGQQETNKRILIYVD